MSFLSFLENMELDIREAIEDYWAHTSTRTDIKSAISDEFISNLAKYSIEAKSELRDLLRKSENWNEDLQALVLHGKAPAEIDSYTVRTCASDLLRPAHEELSLKNAFNSCVELFKFCVDLGETTMVNMEEMALNYEQMNNFSKLKSIAPKAAIPGKKLSRCMRELCIALGIADTTAGSEFEKSFAKFADLVSVQEKDITLYVSINPAHFLTMSNPKGDLRGSTLTSCHSLNSTEYEYNNGCTGYALDDVSMIAFTAADDSQPETLNNRKTTRQIYAYRPYNGVLLQSRMYNTSGGTYGQQALSKIYRTMIEDEIAKLEGFESKWMTGKATAKMYEDLVKANHGFGGYPDWTFPDFDARVSVRKDLRDIFEHDDDERCEHRLYIGEAGLCIVCGDTTSFGLYCSDDCKGGGRVCDDCRELVDNSELYTAYDEHGDEVHVCDDCLSENYVYCEYCDSYHHMNDMITVYTDTSYGLQEEDMCSSCAEGSAIQCDLCNTWWASECIEHVEGWDVCPDCFETSCAICCECERPVFTNNAFEATDSCGDTVYVCSDCSHDYVECPKQDTGYVHRSSCELGDFNECASCPKYLAMHPDEAEDENEDEAESEDGNEDETVKDEIVKEVA